MRMLGGWYGFRMKLVLGLWGENGCDGLCFDKNGLNVLKLIIFNYKNLVISKIFFYLCPVVDGNEPMIRLRFAFVAG